MTEEDWLARARALTPVVRGRSAAANEARRLQPETVRDFVDSGLLRLLQPMRFGGVEQSLETFVRAAIEIGRGCGSAAWVFSIYSNHQWLLGLYPEQAQRDIWEPDPGAICSAGLHGANVKVSREGDGWRLSGEWGFSSGCDNAGWVILAAPVGVKAGKCGNPPHPDLQFFLVPRSDWEVRDTWHVFGLRGTGSNTVLVRDAFVPGHRVLDFIASREARAPGREVNPEPLFRLPAWGNFPIFLAAPAVGIAWGAYDRLIEHLQDRTSAGRRRVAELTTVQMRVAEAAAMIDAAELLLRREAHDSLERVKNGGEADLALRMRNRRDNGYAVLLACQATEKLLRACGGAGLYEDFEIQRCYRDVYATAGHIGTNWDSSATSFGRWALGGGVTDFIY